MHPCITSNCRCVVFLAEKKFKSLSTQSSDTLRQSAPNVPINGHRSPCCVPHLTRHRRRWAFRVYKPVSNFLLLPLVLILTFYVLPASAQSTSEMLSACRPIAQAPVSGEGVAFQQTFESGLCWGAFATVQKIIRYADENGRLFFRVCAPASSRRTQLIAVFVRYAADNPQRLHEDYFPIALDSLQKAFPCSPYRK